MDIRSLGQIRNFRPQDAEALADLFHASVREIGIRGYTAEQVAAWSPARPDPARYLRQAEGRTFLVAVNDDGEPIGYGDVELDGHIDHLFCRPDVVGTGVGSAILRELELSARSSGIAMLYVEASEVARPLFERKGFTVERRREFDRHGVTMHNYRMTKDLRLPSTAEKISHTPR